MWKADSGFVSSHSRGPPKKFMIVDMTRGKMSIVRMPRREDVC